MCLTVGFGAKFIGILVTDRIHYYPLPEAREDCLIGADGRPYERRALGKKVLPMFHGWVTVGGDGDFGLDVIRALRDVDARDVEGVQEVIRSAHDDAPARKSTWITTLWDAGDRFSGRTYDETGKVLTQPNTDEKLADALYGWPREFPEGATELVQHWFVSELRRASTPGAIISVVDDLFGKVVKRLTPWVGPDPEGVILIRDQGRLLEIKIAGARNVES